MTELELYIKENKGELLEIGESIDNSFHIRPVSWAGIWDEDSRLVRGNILAIFNTREDAERALKNLNYNF